MKLTEKVSALQSSAQSQLPALNTLRKTENALLLPFFDALGYDPFDVREVEPEFDVGLEEQGMGTVDYALKREGVPLVFVQCEEAKTDLGTYDNRFLFQHFDDLEANIAVFTNGLSYRFYANLEAEIHTYDRPFLEFDLLDHNPAEIESLKRLTKTAFDTKELLAAAYDLKSGRLLRDYLVQQQESPDEHLVRFMAAQVYEGEVSGEEVDRFRSVVQRVLNEFVGDGSDVHLTVVSREDESTTSTSEERPEPLEQEGSDSPEQEEEPEVSASEAESSSDDVESFSEPPSDEEGDEADGDDPFEKDLARRVIEDF
jgi:hypothetical protein